MVSGSGSWTHGQRKSDAPDSALFRIGAFRTRAHSFHQSRLWIDLDRGDDGRAGVAHARLAKSCGWFGVIRCFASAYRLGVAKALSTLHPEYAAMRGSLFGLGPRHTVYITGSYGKHAICA